MRLLGAAYGIARPLLFRLDGERIHRLTLAAIDRLERAGLLAVLAGAPIEDPVSLLGLRWRNRVGLAAGLDKDAAHLPALARLGFGFIELGTVTPRAQPGNPRPRLFRLPRAQALINRFGFNNVGLEQFVANLERARRNHGAALDGLVIGLNIGKNADTPIDRATDDYLIGLARVSAHADYVTVNISSPNTADLRRLQGGDRLTGLLAALDIRRADLARSRGRSPPLLLKIAPDLEPQQIEHLVDQIRRRAIDGVIATNATIDRAAVAHLPAARESGGLSGAPVRERALRVIAALRAALPTGFPIIGVGGIVTADDALACRAAGADLVQLYTGLVYRGPALVPEVARALAAAGGTRPASR
ncbi:MAG: quinone-dependent dihydroorotate dehydrogenase [Burkholderiaceae bacterium]